MKGRTLMVVLAVLCCSCNLPIKKDSFIEWIRDGKNGLHVIKPSGEFVFDLQFEPVSLVALRQQTENPGVSYETILRESEGLQYYTLTIGLKEQQGDFRSHITQSPTDKERLLYYYSYEFQNDIKLYDGGSTLPCVLYHFERSADLKNARTFVLAFENTTESKEVTLKIHSPVLGPVPVDIKISKRNIPTLKI